MKHKKQVATLDRQGNCPICGASWDGGDIVECFLKMKAEGNSYWSKKTDDEIREEEVKETYSSPYRWSKLIGIELPYGHPKHYDGVSYWKCSECGQCWDRFSGELVTK